jgi:hypothetical protein
MSRVRKSFMKVLSSNDTGETGGHQAGMLIPKERPVLSLFPTLDPGEKNPRATVMFMDEEGCEWAAVLIYYNSRLFGGTRNEYRLTRLGRFIKKYKLRSGDRLIFTRIARDEYHLGFQRRAVPRGRAQRAAEKAGV